MSDGPALAPSGFVTGPGQNGGDSAEGAVISCRTSRSRRGLAAIAASSRSVTLSIAPFVALLVVLAAADAGAQTQPKPAPPATPATPAPLAPSAAPTAPPPAPAEPPLP